MAKYELYVENQNCGTTHDRCIKPDMSKMINVKYYKQPGV